MIENDEKDMNFQQKIINFNCSEHPECEKQAVCLSVEHPFSSRFICIKCILKSNDLDVQKKTFFIRDLIESPKTILEKVIPNQKIQVKKDFYQGLSELKAFFLSFQGLLNNKLLIFQQQYDQLNNVMNSALEQIEKDMKVDLFEVQLNVVKGKENHLETKEYQNLEVSLESISSVSKKFQEKFDSRKFQALERQLITTIDNLTGDIQNFSTKSLSQLKMMKEKFSQSLEKEVMHSYPDLHEQLNQRGFDFKYELASQGIQVSIENHKSIFQQGNQIYNMLLILENDCGNVFGGFKASQNSRSQSLESFLFSYSTGRFTKYEKKKENNGQMNSAFLGQLGVLADDSLDKYSPNLGQIFDIKVYALPDRQTKLFGGQVVDIKIFYVK